MVTRRQNDKSEEDSNHVLEKDAKVDFVVAGAGKAATTFFHELFTKHRYVTMASYDEVHYFSHYFEEGIEWYHAQFDDFEGLIRGEVSPHYMLDGAVFAPRMLKYNPDIKLIFCLRNQADRTWSHYWNNFRKGSERLGLYDALAAEEWRCKSSYKAFFRFSYILKSRYAKLLEPFYKLFDRNNILIVIYENYLNDPRGENLRIQKFLGLPDDAPLDEELIRTPVNPGRIPRSLRLNRLMYRYIRLFRLTRTTKPWRLVRNANLRLGSALPKIDEETASYITELVDEDRGELLDLIQLDRVPWD